MAGDTKIGWADASWNPIVGCEIVSPGCKNCYAMGQAARIERMAAGAGRTSHYAGTTQPSKAGPVWTGKIALAAADAIAAPLRWRRPRRIFVNSMGDPFAPGVTDAMRDRAWAVMACARRHVFIVLTKRVEAMRAYVEALRERPGAWGETPVDHATGRRPLIEPVDAEAFTRPLPNVWLGVTAEDQVRADERIPELLATPAARRIVSLEPLIGPVQLDPLWLRASPSAAFLGGLVTADMPSWTRMNSTALDWVIVGGESGRGPGIRPMHPDWARQVRDDCAAAGVAYFFKQQGEWARHRPTAGGDLGGDVRAGRVRFVHLNNHTDSELCARSTFPGDVYMARVGTRAAGDRLDGVQHHAWPESAL